MKALPSVTTEPIRIGVSACVLGERVRYDGDHKLDSYVRDTLGHYFDLVPVCPEVAIGLGVPRPPIKLVGNRAAPRAVGVVDPKLDVTDKLAAYGRRTARTLSDISGYILKSGSPSCGKERVILHATRGRGARVGRGIYAAALMKVHPLLPVTEEMSLGDPILRDSFLERVFVYRRWQVFTATVPTVARLAEFHTAHALLLMAHGTERAGGLDRIVTRATRGNLRLLTRQYAVSLMRTLDHRATRQRQARALRHACRYLEDINGTSCKDLRELIEGYRSGGLPLVTPWTRVRDSARRYPSPWLDRQVYLNPDPGELALRFTSEK